MFKISYIYDLVDHISPQLKKIQANLQQVNNKVSQTAQSMSTSFNNIGRNLNNVGQSFKNIGSTLAPASVAMGLIGAKAISSASNFETLGIQLEILTGSAEKGKNLFQELAKYSAETPFELPDIVQATRTLLGSNIALKDVVATTKMLGDVSAGSGADIKSLAVVYGQVAGMTKLQGQDAMQFVSNGIPIWALLQKTTGKSINQLRELATDGKISFDIVNKALTQATQKNGMYYQATEKLSKSLGGLYSTLKDNVNIAFGDLGAEMVKAINLQQLITQISDFAGKLTAKFKALSPESKKFITYAVLIVSVLAPVALILGSLIGIVGLVISGFGLLAGAFALLLNPFRLIAFLLYYLVIPAFNAFVSPLGIVSFGISALILLFFKLKDSFIIIYDFLKDKFAGAFDYVADKIKMVMDLINKFRTDSAVVLNFLGLEKMANFVSPEINQPSQINKSQSLTAGGQLDVNIKGLPKGSNAGFTPRPNNFLPVGVNSVFAGM